MAPTVRSSSARRLRGSTTSRSLPRTTCSRRRPATCTAFRDALPAEQVLARARGFDPDAGFTLLLDNEAEEPDGALRAGPEAADWSHLPASFELDEPWVGAGTYWDRLDRQNNVSEALRAMLRTAYGANAHAEPAEHAQHAAHADRRLDMTGTKGIALHIGLNRVDPAHYSGWDGTLHGV